MKKSVLELAVKGKNKNIKFNNIHDNKCIILFYNSKLDKFFVQVSLENSDKIYYESYMSYFHIMNTLKSFN
jgi:hypothetical protein